MADVPSRTVVNPEGRSAPCVFCEIRDRTAPAHILYEDDSTLVFLDLFPLTRGHCLVIPKRHVDRLTDLQPDEQVALLATLTRICRRVEGFTRHYNLGINQGELAGQVVFHLHVHVIPRYPEAANLYPARPRVRIVEKDIPSVLASYEPRPTETCP